MFPRTDVSMLWEAVDPACTLATRFGFIEVDHAVSWLESTLQEAWGRHVMADLAQAAVLLGTRYLDWEPTSSETRSRFVAAYSELAPLNSAERDELPRRIRTVLDHFGWR